MAIQLRDPNEGKLSAIGDMVAQLLLNRANATLKERELAIQEGRLENETEEMRARRRAEAFDRAMKVAAVTLQPGDSPRSKPALLPIFREAFSEFDDDTFASFSEIPWGRQTLQEVLDQRAIEMVNDQNLDPAMRQRIYNNYILGQARTNTQLQADVSADELKGLQAQVLMGGVEELRRDPQFIRDATLGSFGLDQEIRFGWGGKEYKFSTDTAANIWAQLFSQDQEFSFRLETMSEEKKQDLAAEIMDLGVQVDAPIGRAAAMEILNAYNESASGDFNPGESPIEQLFLRSDEAKQRVIKAFTNGVDMAADAWIRAQPESIQNFLNMGEALETRFGNEVAKELMEDWAKKGIIPGVGRAGLRNPFKKNTFTFEQDPSQAASTLTEQQIRGIADDLSSGMTEEELQRLGLQIGVTITPGDFERARQLNQTVRPSDPNIPQAPTQTSPTGGLPGPEGAPVRQPPNLSRDMNFLLRGLGPSVPIEGMATVRPTTLQEWITQRGEASVPAVIKEADRQLQATRQALAAHEATVRNTKVEPALRRIASQRARMAEGEVRRFEMIINNWLKVQR